MKIIDDEGFEFIKERESCKLKAYKDIAGVWTIGFGTVRYPNGERVKQGDSIDIREAEYYLFSECMGICKKIESLLTVPLNRHQINALVSFCYNVGVQAFKTSTLRQRINKGMSGPPILEAFEMWNKAHVDGKLVSVKGLTERRRLEFRLFSTIDEE